MKTTLQRIGWAPKKNGVKIIKIGKPKVYEYDQRKIFNHSMIAVSEYMINGRKRKYGLEIRTFDEKGKLVDRVIFYPPSLSSIRSNI